MEGIILSYSAFGGLSYVRGTVIVVVGRAVMTLKNSHESVIVSLTINVQPTRSIDEHLLCVLLSVSGKEA